MRNIINVKCFLLALYFFGICFAIDTTSEKMPQEIESRLINSGESDTLLPKSELVQLLKDLADQSTHRQQLALARSDAPTTPTVFDYFDEVLWTLMSMVDCNVIVADWRRGAEGPKYPTAAANTPMVGVEISMLLQKIIKATNCTLSPDNITLVGFSLGAHVVGFAGRHFYKKTTMKLDRIIGLDPAGALFEGTKVSLSHRDAKYVDVIHTNGGPIWTFKLAFSKPMGHVDFYPNGGSNQPNCSIYPKINITVLKTANSSTEALLSILESMACSHYRAPELLKESLTNRNCNFTSYPCPEGWQNFKNCSERFKHNKTVIGLMGYYSYTRQGKGVQYLKTNNATPYCIPETDKSAEVCR